MQISAGGEITHLIMAQNDTSISKSIYKNKTHELQHKQSGRSPKVVALFSATNFSSNIIELLQLHDTIHI